MDNLVPDSAPGNGRGDDGETGGRNTAPHRRLRWPLSSWLVGKSLVRGLSNTRDVKSRRVDLVL
jgi:hypothetical protein